MIDYLHQKAFSIPPRIPNTAVQTFTVQRQDGSEVLLPRGYRVPLMFVSKFQWDSLYLVMTAPDPENEWREYRFDIVHLSRLCTHLLEQAENANDQAIAEGKKGVDKHWRSPMFDRVLTRFYRRWFVSREWSLKKFWLEFDEEEYETDVLKYGKLLALISHFRNIPHPV